MALVSRKHSFIFIHIYRSGGNSVRKALGSPAVGYYNDILGGQEVLGVHANAIDLKQHYYNVGDTNFFNHAFKFTVVRNPFSWLVSTYKYIKHSPGHNFNKIMHNKSYYGFLMWYVNEAMMLDRPFGSNKYSTLLDFVTDEDGNVIVDYIGKMENLGAALGNLSLRAGVKIRGRIPHINKTNSTEWKSYYADRRCVDMVYKHFGADLDAFGYDFGGM